MPRVSPTGADLPIAPAAPRAFGVAPSPLPASRVLAGNPIMLPADEEELAGADSAQAAAAPSGATMASSSSWCLLSGNAQAPSIDDMDLDGADFLRSTPTAAPKLSVGVTPLPASSVLIRTISPVPATDEIDLAGANLPLAGNSRVPSVDDDLSGAGLALAAATAPSGVTMVSSSSRCLLAGAGDPDPRARPTDEMDLDGVDLLARTASPGVGVASSPVRRVLADNSRAPHVHEVLAGAALALVATAPSGVTMVSSSSRCLLVMAGDPDPRARARPSDEMDLDGADLLIPRTASAGVGVASSPVERVLAEVLAGAATAPSGISMAPTSSRCLLSVTGNLRVSPFDEHPAGADVPLAPAPAPAPLPGVGVESLPPWCILATIPRVTSSDQQLGGSDLSVAITAPPGISIVSVPPRVCHDPITHDNFPSVLAADPSGLLLLYATQGERTGPVHCGRRFAWRRFIDGYFICDASSATVVRLPDPQNNYIVNSGNVGLVTMPGRRDCYVVAELQPIIGTDFAKLLCFSSATGLWEEKSVDYPLEGNRPWGSHGVLSHLGKLWWVDISWGLLTCCLPSDESSPDLQFVPLPIGKKLPYQCNEVDLEMYRCVKVSSGKLCFVEICCPAKPRVIVHKLRSMVGRHGHHKVPWIVMWSLIDAELGLWRREYEMSFDDIWLHKSYRKSGLPKRVPRLATVDPSDLHVVYFFLDKSIFGVNLLTKTLVKQSDYKLDSPPSKHISSRFVCAWELPRAG